MGKHKKKKRNHSGSSDHHSRSRSRDKHKGKSSDEDSGNHARSSIKNQDFVSSISHRYYLCNETKSIGIPYVAWNLCLKYAPRPHNVLIVCQSMPQIAAICQANKLNRSFRIIDENESSVDLTSLVKKQRKEIILITQKKCSIMLALEQYKKLFNLILTLSKCVDTQFYIKLLEASLEKAHIVTFVDTVSSIKKLSDYLQVDFLETQAQISKQQIHRQIVSDIQLAPKPSNQIICQLSSLSFSMQEIAGRFFELQLSRREPPKSIHLSMPGYITYQLQMDVQFNSFKYVWNFLREEFPKALYESVKGMQKYQNQKGVVFNIPEELKYLADVVSQKLRKNRLKFKGIELSLCEKIPLLQDTDSEEYRLLKQKKKLAMQHKDELQIFIGGIPYQLDENALKLYFKDNNINLFLVRILKDEKGFSKGIGFGLCENKEHFNRAVRLNGSRLIDRTIRVKLADQRKD